MDDTIDDSPYTPSVISTTSYCSIVVSCIYKMDTYTLYVLYSIIVSYRVEVIRDIDILDRYNRGSISHVPG